MTKITESAIEDHTIELLEKQGYQYIYAPDIAPDSDMPGRERWCRGRPVCLPFLWLACSNRADTQVCPYGFQII